MAGMMLSPGDKSDLLDEGLARFSGFLVRTKYHIWVPGLCRRSRFLCSSSSLPSLMEEKDHEMLDSVGGSTHEVPGTRIHGRPTPGVGGCKDWEVAPFRIPIDLVQENMKSLFHNCNHSAATLLFKTQQNTFGFQSQSKDALDVANVQDLLWASILHILLKKAGVMVCYRCAEDAKLTMLRGAPPQSPFLYHSNVYMEHCHVIHQSTTLARDTEYICRKDADGLGGTSCGCIACQCIPSLLSTPSSSFLSPSGLSEEKLSFQSSGANFQSLKRKRGEANYHEASLQALSSTSPHSSTSDSPRAVKKYKLSLEKKFADQCFQEQVDEGDCLMQDVN